MGPGPVRRNQPWAHLTIRAHQKRSVHWQKPPGLFMDPSFNGQDATLRTSRQGFDSSRVYHSIAHDGLTGDWPLTFVPISVGKRTHPSAVFEVAVEWNTCNGRRRPYLAIVLGPLHIQSGWLFG